VVGDILTLQGETAGQAVLEMQRIDGIGGAESSREAYL
jgi:hypothetical protein